MDPRHLQVRPSPDDCDKETDDTDGADSPLAADRFSQAAERITRKINRVPERKTPSDRFATLRLIGIGTIVMIIIAVLGIIVRFRGNHSPEAAPAIVAVNQVGQPTTVSPEPSPSQLLPAQDTLSNAPPPRNLPSTTTVAKETAESRSAYVNTLRRRPGPRQIPLVKRPPVPAADTPSLPDSSFGDEATDVDHAIAFYEPVNHAAKSGSFNVRSGSGGKYAGRTGSTTEPKQHASGNFIKTTASIIAKAGGVLNEVLENNRNYYKVKLTLPLKRIEYLKKSLAAQYAVTALSVTAESTTDGISVIILEMNTR